MKKDLIKILLFAFLLTLIGGLFPRDYEVLYRPEPCPGQPCDQIDLYSAQSSGYGFPYVAVYKDSINNNFETHPHGEWKLNIINMIIDYTFYLVAITGLYLLKTQLRKNKYTS